MTFGVSQEIYFLADDKVTLYPMARQGLKSLADSLNHLKMTLIIYIYTVFLYCG